MAKLTKGFIDKVAPPDKGDAFHWDIELKGFGLRVNAAGRTFVVQGRIGSGRSARAARITIGPYGVFTVDQARDVAREHLRSMRMGVDPRTAGKATAIQRRTLREVADDYMRDIPLKDTTKRAVNQAVGGTFGALGWADKPLASITRAMVDERFLEMRERAPGNANHAFSILGMLFNYAIRQYTNDDKTPIFKDNPVKVLHRKWAKLKPRTGRIEDDKLGEVWKHLQAARQRAHNGQTASGIDLIAFLMLTGARLSEACQLTWDRVNLEEGWWHIPDLKNGNKVWLPLSTQAVELLRSRQNRGIKNPYVFPSSEHHIVYPRDSMRNVSKVAGCKITPHDLRRTFTHVGAWLCRIDIQKVELLTNHVPTSVTARHYLETEHLEYLKPEVQQIADRICS